MKALKTRNYKKVNIIILWPTIWSCRIFMIYLNHILINQLSLNLNLGYQLGLHEFSMVKLSMLHVRVNCPEASIIIIIKMLICSTYTKGCHIKS